MIVCLLLQDWASGVGVEVSTITDDFMTLQVDIQLTKKGLAEQQKVM
jgi:secreted Zn-dependent insulinase-like peptidase